MGKLAAGAMFLALFAAAGCGGDAAGSEGATGDGNDADATANFEDAMVEYAACMREHGIDMPDPQVQSDGGDVTTGKGGMVFAMPLGATSGANGEVDETFAAASEECSPILEAVRREMPKLSPEEEAKMRDNALKFAQCMREHGIDMPDPTFDTTGGPGMAIRGGSKSEELTPFDADKFNEAAGECSEEGGPTFSVSSADGGGGNAVGGIRIGSASGASK